MKIKLSALVPVGSAIPVMATQALAEQTREVQMQPAPREPSTDVISQTHPHRSEVRTTSMPTNPSPKGQRVWCFRLGTSLAPLEIADLSCRLPKLSASCRRCKLRSL